jgi:N-acyl-D-glutamate deacylase
VLVSKVSTPFPFVFALLLCGSALAESYDIVIDGGRVMDPETGLDAVRNVGITHDKVARIKDEQLTGARVLSARGLVVAPGFVDLHQHGQDNESGGLKASMA